MKKLASIKEKLLRLRWNENNLQQRELKQFGEFFWLNPKPRELFYWIDNKEVCFNLFKFDAKRLTKWIAYRVWQSKLCSYQKFGFISVVIISKKLNRRPWNHIETRVYSLRNKSGEKITIFVKIEHTLMAKVGWLFTVQLT